MPASEPVGEGYQSVAFLSPVQRPASPVRYGPGVPDQGFRATTRRSVDLFRAFRLEQTQPDVFYGALARDSADQVAALHPLGGALLLDVGGGPGYFADAFGGRGAKGVIELPRGAAAFGERGHQLEFAA